MLPSRHGVLLDEPYFITEGCFFCLYLSFHYFIVSVSKILFFSVHHCYTFLYTTSNKYTCACVCVTYSQADVCTDAMIVERSQLYENETNRCSQVQNSTVLCDLY